jgi:CRISPR-associated endonuclease/helicase Cas3
MNLKAKSTGLSLLQHTLDVLGAAEFLFDQKGRLLESWLRFFKLQRDESERFWRILKVAILFHDWGKANRGFQGLLVGEGDQLIRHEHLSALLLNLPVIQKWLSPILTDSDYDIVLSTVACHHLKLPNGDDSQSIPIQGQDERCIYMLTETQDHAQFLAETAKYLGLPEISVQIPIYWLVDSTVDSGHEIDTRLQIENLLRRLRRFHKRCRWTKEMRLLQAVRSALIACDAAGSGLVRTGQPIQAWLQQCFPVEKLASSAIWEGVIKARVEELSNKGRWKGWNEFQNQCGDPQHLPARSLLLAPCGSGKTLAGWRWICSTLESFSARRVLFLYPTRGTATEGFRDYVAWAPEALRPTLAHGTSQYELDSLQSNPDEADDPRWLKNFQAERTLFALGLWTKQIFSATVDQFLPFLQHHYAAMCCLPVLAESVVVIDEIHSFDPMMYSTLRHFLQEFDVPVLCMTASLQTSRRQQLEELGLKVYSERPEDLRRIADEPRYLIEKMSEVDALVEVANALQRGMKVLWVCNRVSQAQRIFTELAWERKYCYHSRFRLKDRKKRHELVVKELRTGQPAALAVTTQVCEMSLDLDADIVVTEECPIPALIQRMGRCNRVPVPRLESGRVIVLNNTRGLPYAKEDYVGLDAFLDHLVGQRVGQSSLETALEAHLPACFEPQRYTPFTESGPFASSVEQDFRDLEEFSVQAVLDEDVRRIAQKLQQRQPIDEFVLPVPRFACVGSASPPVPRYLRIAPGSQYCREVGFRVSKGVCLG